MRESEEEMLNAEKYSSLAWLSGAAYPATQLTEAWKKVLFNQFHDLAAGSGIGVIYRDAQEDYDMVRWASAEATSNALKTLAHEVSTTSANGGGVPVLVFNPLAWERTDLVTADVQMPGAEKNGISVLDEHGKPLLFQALSADAETRTYHLLIQAKDVPSLGYEVLHVMPGPNDARTDLHASGLTLENALLRVTLKLDASPASTINSRSSSPSPQAAAETSW